MTAPLGQEVTRENVELSRRLRRVSVSAAQQAARHLRPAFRSRMHVAAKGNLHDLVTEHDLTSEHILRSALFAAEPDSTVLGEEGGAVGSGRIRWHVDPIDGTVNFAAGIAFWCVSVAAEVDGEVVAGAILEPMSGHEFSVDVDGLRLDGELVSRCASARPESEAAVVCTFPRFVDLEANGDDALAATGQLIRSVGSLRSLGSGALGLAYVAMGWADATFELHTNSWDVAAGQLMVRAVGGRYIGLRCGEADESPGGAFLAPGYCAFGPGAEHPNVLRLIRSLSATARPI